MKKGLIIGGGFAGCTAAELMVKKGYETTLVEAAPFLGGGCKTFYYGGHPYTFGPRHFLTKSEKHFKELSSHVPMRRIPEHEFLTYIERDQSFYHFPIHKDDVDLMPDKEKIHKELGKCLGPEGAKNLEEFWVNSVGPTLYSKFVESYSKKMWDIESNTELDVFSYTAKGEALATGPKAAWTSEISAFPVAHNGYDDYFTAATKDTKVHLNTRINEYDIPNYRVKLGDEWKTFDIIVSSISSEYLFKQCYGPLRWMGRDFMKIVLPVEEALPKNAYFLYYANQEPFTRIVEYKKFFNGYQAPTTLLGLEIPSMSNKLYPFTTLKDQDFAQKYMDILPERVFLLGRAAQYRYIDVGRIFHYRDELELKL